MGVSRLPIPPEGEDYAALSGPSSEPEIGFCDRAQHWGASATGYGVQMPPFMVLVVFYVLCSVIFLLSFVILIKYAKLSLIS